MPRQRLGGMFAACAALLAADFRPVTEQRIALFACPSSLHPLIHFSHAA